MQKWEYLYLTAHKNDVESINEKLQRMGRDSLPGYLNKLGDAGWELVNSFLNSPIDANSFYWTFVFKRPKE